MGGEFGIFGRVNVIVLLDFVFLLTKSVMMDAQQISAPIPLQAVFQDMIAHGIPMPLGKIIA